MAELKFTKSELRAQQNRLNQLDKYLPTLQLKKAMLQAEVSEARTEIAICIESHKRLKKQVDAFSCLFAAEGSIDFSQAAKMASVKRRYENIAGVEVPYFESVCFEAYEYALFDTAAWTEAAVRTVRDLEEAKIKTAIAEEKKEALEKELRDVSIRVNLFEKILIPRASKNIKKIKVFLGDQQLAAVSQAKAAKSKIESLKKAIGDY